MKFMKALIRGEFGLGETLWKFGIGVMVVAMVLFMAISALFQALGLFDSNLVDSGLFYWFVGFILVGFVYFTIQTIGLMRAFINDPKTKSGPRGRTWTTKIAATWILFYFAIWLSFFREVL